MPFDLLVLISNNRNTYLFSDTRPVTCQILKKCPTVPPTHMCTLPPRFHEEKKKKRRGDIIVPAPFWCYTLRIKQRNFHSVDCQPYLMICLDLLAFCSVALNFAERRVLDLAALQSVTRPLCRGGPPPSQAPIMSKWNRRCSLTLSDTLFIWLYPQITYEVVDSKTVNRCSKYYSFFGDTKTLLD